jgi:hypothetical protein
MKHVICAAILALFAPITALPATAQLEETSDERVALPLPLSNSNAYAFRLEEADQQAKNRVHHDLSGLVCPYIIDRHALTKITQFSHSGHDVSCGYNSQEANSYITVYMSRYGEDATPSAMMEQASLQLEAAYNVVSSEEAKPTEISFGDAPLQCLQRQYKIIVGAMPRNSGIWTCNLDGWVFKVRATWIGDDIVPFAGIDSFTSRQKASAETLQTCAATRRGFQSIETAAEAENSIASVLAYALEMPEASDLVQPLCFLDQYNNSERALVVGWIPTGDEPTYFAHQYDSFGPIPGTHVELLEAPEDASMIAAELTGVTEKLWHLRGYPDTDSVDLFKEYLGQPTPDQFTSDALAMTAGELPPLGGVQRGEDGNIELVISDASLDTEEEDEEPKPPAED